MDDDDDEEEEEEEGFDRDPNAEGSRPSAATDDEGEESDNEFRQDMLARISEEGESMKILRLSINKSFPCKVIASRSPRNKGRIWKLLPTSSRAGIADMCRGKVSPMLCLSGKCL